MATPFTIVPGAKLTCSLASDQTKQFSIDYYGTLRGYVWWVFGWADWIKVNDTHLYVDHKSVTDTIGKVKNAVKQVQDDHAKMENTLTLDAFYEKVFTHIPASPTIFEDEAGSIQRELNWMNSLDSWIQQKVEYPYNDRLWSIKTSYDLHVSLTRCVHRHREKNKTE